MDGAVFLICLLFGLRCSSIGADRLLGGDRIGEGTTTSWRVLANEYLLDLPLPVSVPSMSHCCLAFSADPPILVGNYGQSFMRALHFFSWVVVSTGPVCALQKCSLCFSKSHGFPVIRHSWLSNPDSLFQNQVLSKPPPLAITLDCKP